MMAISALSLDRKCGSHSIDALNYYHQAFLSLQSSIWNEKDLLLDGLFLTHFLLLAYEVGFTFLPSFPSSSRGLNVLCDVHLHSNYVACGS
jgi:hypothetical protein